MAGIMANYTQSGWNIACSKSGIWCAFAQGCNPRNKKNNNCGIDMAEYMGIMEWRGTKLSISIL